MAKRYIDQFMWGYQDFFRSALETEVDSVFKSVGFHGNPKTTLVGFQVSGQRAFSICIEQGETRYKPSDLESVQQLADQKYAANSDSNSFHSDPRMNESFHASLKNRMRAEALEETLSKLSGEEERVFFAGNAVRVDDYAVHIIISVDRQAVAGVPRISTVKRDRFRIHPSLFHAVTSTTLGLAEQSLYFPDAGTSLRVLHSSPGEVVRSATESMMHALLYCAGYWFGNDSHLLMNSLSALPYEGREGSGRLVLAKSDDPAIDVMVSLSRPISARNMLAVRKILEASGPTADVLFDGEKVYGLGNINSAYDATTESVFVVTFASRGVWELSHAGVVLLAVRDGIPSLPTYVLDEFYFVDLIERLFPQGDTDLLLEAARAAGDHRHGAMLVISADAAGEAQRLSPQCWSVSPAPLAPELITQLTDMDGAVLLDPSGQCHAIGVILDGEARGEGDPARGSRLNNAVRYLGSDSPPAIVVVYSADGGIDILPHMPSRVRKEDVEKAVTNFLELATRRPPDFESTYRAWDAVKSFVFYLSQAQCDSLNKARNDLEEWRMENNGMQVGESQLEPSAAMNDTYWF
ncbi:diadenylate cyclase [Streptomyces sp. NPDC057137]|uniref:diadenylate cyclase n=1 Tax=Streptomyces sp. NPDC057137 TaxID=3346030 RepID=UPI0036388335